MTSAKDSQAVIKVGQFTIRLYKNLLYCEKIESQPVPESILIELKDNQTAFTLPAGSLFSNHTVRLSVKAKTGLEQETVKIVWADVQLSKSKITPNKGSGSKKVSELLKQKSCPAWLRK